ncbi:hypothetical protein RHMOL_Rhmol03G0187900 [Rhododendron molle]|uniref:Uncharacterized protein n=1 Tax=Rhododendron molle TaxID=49168 RepID=A0ACC0PHG0_RHOML|nr:hypothetical protein RHMOL_Rhmol03G0187900 [Rhododendron molle]
MKTEKFDWVTIEGYPMTKYQADLLLPEPALLHLGGSHFCFLTPSKISPETPSKFAAPSFEFHTKVASRLPLYAVKLLLSLTH